MENIETKIIRPAVHLFEGGNFDELQDVKAFGWEIQSQQEYEYRGGRAHHKGTEYVLVRRLNLPNLMAKKQLEARYLKAKETLAMPPDSADVVIGLGLLLLLIIPGVIYFAVTNSRHRQGVEKNQQAIAIMKDCVNKAKAL